MLFLTTSIKPAKAHHAIAASLAGRGIYIALGSEKGIVVAKLGDESYYIGVGLRVPEDWRVRNASLLGNPDALRCELREQFAGWSEKHIDVIKHSEGALHTWPQYSLAPEGLEWESAPGITLIGDAAHLT